MSVILDALQRARRDDHRHASTTSNAVEVSRPAPRIIVEQKSGRLILTAVLLTFFMVWLFAAAGVLYWFFYYKPSSEAAAAKLAAQQIPAPAVQAAPVAAPVTMAAQPVVQPPLAIPSAVELPPPVPITSLPANSSSGAQVTYSRQENAGSAAINGASAAATKEQKLVLGTIMCDVADCAAMINGRTVRHGQSIMGYTVLDVTATEVTLRRGNEEPIYLSLVPK
jgi:hypothetical protein